MTTKGKFLHTRLMKLNRILLNFTSFRTICLCFILLFTLSEGQGQDKTEIPITASWLKKHLVKKTPRLILTPAAEKIIKQRMLSDTLMSTYVKYLQKESAKILEKPLLKRELEGFRLLAVSREMVERMGVLSMVYRLEKNPVIIKRIEAEIQAVCDFEDWNPQHFLDVAEMSFAVAIAVDWAGEFMSPKIRQKAKESLIEKGIKPSFREDGPRMGWINGTNNWNAVCHGGLIAAALTVADLDPELAAGTIARAVDKLPNSLKGYEPDGVYPEGPTYWEYGTSYTVVASNCLTSALGNDFGISKAPGFMESALFRLYVTAPSGNFFNFADSGDQHGGSGSVLLSWFAAHTGDALFFDENFFRNPENGGRFAGPGLVWLSQVNRQKISELKQNWIGQGLNPVAVFRGQNNHPDNFYLAVKGGRANLSHGNMDAGTFVFELNGVRWVTDPGNQSYYPLNKIGFPLSDHSQNGERWTLLTKKNQGHSTITINNERFLVNAKAELTDFKDGPQPEVSIDMTSLYGNNAESVKRRFIKESDDSFRMEDEFVINDSTRNITWGVMTTAHVNPAKNGAILTVDGKQLMMEILEPAGASVNVISLDPPPLEIDKTIPGLKRIEIQVPAWTVKNKKGKIGVRWFFEKISETNQK